MKSVGICFSFGIELRTYIPYKETHQNDPTFEILHMLDSWTFALTEKLPDTAVATDNCAKWLLSKTSIKVAFDLDPSLALDWKRRYMQECQVMDSGASGPLYVHVQDI